MTARLCTSSSLRASEIAKAPVARLFIAGALVIAVALVIAALLVVAALLVIAGHDPQSSIGVALDPGSGPG